MRPISNKKLKDVTKSKSIRNMSGRLFVDVIVKSPMSYSRGEPIYMTTREIGEASGNMKDFDNIKFNAVDNAFHKHVSKGGKSPVILHEFVNYWIKYFDVADDRITSKRKKIRGKYRVITRKKGKIIGNEPWSYRRGVSTDDFF